MFKGVIVDSRLKCSQLPEKKCEKRNRDDMSGEKPKHQQVVTGSLDLIRWTGPVIVCAEYWPSWSFALDALGCTDIKTYARFASPTAKKEFQATSLGRTLEGNIQPLILEVGKKCVPPLIFLQGSE